MLIVVFGTILYHHDNNFDDPDPDERFRIFLISYHFSDATSYHDDRREGMPASEWKIVSAIVVKTTNPPPLVWRTTNAINYLLMVDE